MIPSLSDIQEAEIHKLSRFYWNEALRCEKVKAYLAGSIMAGSSLEAMLTLMVNAYPEEAIATNECPRKKGGIKSLLEWKLSELLKVAKAANWLPYGLELSESWNQKKAKVGDYAEAVRQLRNFVHPSRYVQDHAKKRITAKYLQTSFTVVSAAVQWLSTKAEKSILEET